ncbi:Kazal-type serine protease inhibitor domain-containing protein [Hoeflea sp. G2-23]|uniref:Kazal-type serine protease inhibitor domain-containing protein n=1 Tax=Hoeflea algicola TaxID=2983763 RepID=A0ABT3Z3D6_9HYPH|nr:Kazal-type serine protease inhibitor domain-containing protein [Hoeflea algicola]MCY0146234.1 Kazal-type serine protease inhibitor domain-containing protein [Hoeflea algicola]
MSSGLAMFDPTRILTSAGWRLFAVAAAGLLLSACEVTETTTTYRSGPVCAAVYQPVCAERRGDRQGFPNACEARAEGWQVVAEGQCGRSDARGNRGRDYRDSDRRDDRDSRNSRRDRDYQRRDSRDSSRRDRNRDADATRRPRERTPETQAVTPNRPARPARRDSSNRPDRSIRPAAPAAPAVAGGTCPQVFQQVCGQLNGRTQMFMNSCVLNSAGAVAVAAGQCMGSNN